jgi:hypothetical protein
MRRCHYIYVAVCLYVAHSSYAQQVGIARIPEEALKATIMIERMEIVPVTRYQQPPNVLAVIERQGTNAAIVAPKNLFTEVKSEEVKFPPLGSGVLVSFSSRCFVVTAGHVVPPDETVYYRIPQKNAQPPQHRPHKAICQITGLGWIRCTNADVAVTSINLNDATDDVKIMPLQDCSAAYENVSIGDDIFVAGYPSSVINVDDPAMHIIRSGIIASKFGDKRLLIDAFTFPGDSGGPVFWKPSVGLAMFPDVKPRPPSLVGVVITSPLYSEGAVSPVSGRTRITFESNAGLTEVVSVSRILEVMNYPEVSKAIARWNSTK